MNPLVLTINEHGIPLAWSTWQDIVIYKAKGLVVWEIGEHSWTKYGGINRSTRQISEVSFSSIVAIKGTHRPKRQVPPLNNTNLFGRDLNICAYCGNKFQFRLLTNDHVVPRSRGGKHVWTNCVTACKKCNNAKGDLPLERTDMKLLYVPYEPCREEALILHNRTILSDQMIFLNNSLPEHSRLKYL